MRLTGLRKRISAAGLTFMLLMLMSITVSAATKMNKSSVTIQTGDKYQLSVLVNGVEKQADAWGSSEKSVAAVNSSGTVTGKAAGSSVITAMVDGTTVECVVSVVKRSTTETMRYNVLVLDVSGSMKGTPLKRVKEAAKRFSKSVLKSSGKNYLAIVTLETTPKVVCNFTDDYNLLSKKISALKAGSGTNLNNALKKAGTLLETVSGGSNVMKNVVICSDGLPKNGTKSGSGKYDSSDHKYYKYANAAYKTDTTLKNKGYFIYALGFFHNSSGKDLTFGKRLMKDLASKDKYYVVTNTKDIDKVFNNIAEQITKTTINKSAVSLYVGETYKLKAYVNGASASAAWKSSDPSVATVSSSGKVTAKKKGTATVTGTVDGKSVICTVTVKRPTITLNKSSVTIYVGKSVTLKATVNGKNSTVTWKSADKSIATVNKKGKVVGKKEGTVKIRANANGVSAVCKVTVKVKHPEYSQYFMVDDQRSRYGSEIINEYGCRLVTNEGAVIEKCAVYLHKLSDGVYERTMAVTGTDITWAKYVPYLAYNGKIYYDGLTSWNINVFYLSKNSDGIWSYKGSYDLFTANLQNANGKELSPQSTGVAGKNTKIFYDLDKMKEWLKK